MRCMCILYSFLYLICLNISQSNGMHMIIKSVDSCDPNKDYEILFKISVQSEGQSQYFDANYTLKSPINDDLKLRVNVEKLIGKTFVSVIRFGDDRACTALHKYLGEFLYSFERASGLRAGMCPIPQGRYQLRHWLSETNKITLQSFPTGILRYTLELINKNREVLCCLIAVVDNV